MLRRKRVFRYLNFLEFIKKKKQMQNFPQLLSVSKDEKNKMERNNTIDTSALEFDLQFRFISIMNRNSWNPSMFRSNHKGRKRVFNRR